MRPILVAAALLAFASCAFGQSPAGQRLRIIDMNLYARAGDSMDSVLRGMDESGIELALLFGLDTTFAASWREAAPDRFIVGPAFPCTDGLDPRSRPCFEESNGWPSLEWMRREYESGRMGVMGEINYVYYGIPPTDERLEPYWALAEELDIPVGVHIGGGPRPARAGCCPNFNGDYGNPALLRPVLQRHPRLRLWLMHVGGNGFLDEAIALMKAHPNVYADMSLVNSEFPATHFERSLHALLDAGLGDRIMFGSDNRPLRTIVERMKTVPFLTSDQRDDIFYNNALRFLRLDATGISR
jgi:hypothetical protein